MPTNLFISFERRNLQQVNNLRDLAKSRINDLEFHDRSEIEPVFDRNGKPLRYPPSHDGAEPIKEKLRGLLNKATKMVVVIGEFTHSSAWVTWEIQYFHTRMNNKTGDAEKRLIAMYVKKASGFTFPRILRTLSIPYIKWDIDVLTEWISANPNQSLPTLPLLYE